MNSSLLISSKAVNAQLKELFLKLPDFVGSIEVITYAQKLTRNERWLSIVNAINSASASEVSS